MKPHLAEEISALTDQEADPSRRSALFDRITADPAAAAAWQRNHLIGGVLRGEVTRADFDASTAIRERLAAEPTVLVPTALSPVPAPTVAWKSAAGLALAASLAVLAVTTFPPAPTDNADAGGGVGGALVATISPDHMREFDEMLAQHGAVASSPGLNGLVVYAKLVSNTKIEHRAPPAEHARP